MDEIRYLKDSIRPNDEYKVNNGILIPNPQRVNSKVNIYNEVTGELIFEGHNKTVIAGSALTAMKLFNLDHGCLNNTPTYDSIMNLDNGSNGETYPTTIIKDNITGDIIGSIQDETQRKIIGFCVGQGGAGLDISDVFDVKYTSWITPDNLIPFRYPLQNADSVDEDIYKGRKALELADKSKRNAYYFKAFSNSPKLVQNYVSNIGTFSDNVSAGSVYNNTVSDKAQSYVELHLKITKDDCREFFIAHKGIENAKINQISLVSAWEKEVEVEKLDSLGNLKTKKYQYFQDIRPFSIINIPNEIISNHEKSLSIVYSLFF